MSVVRRVILTSVCAATGTLTLLLATPLAFADWALQDSGTSYDFCAVDFVSRNTGFAIGNENGQTTGSVVIKTTDGGRTWTAITPSVPLEPLEVDFVDAHNGWVSGGGILLHTTDGGVSWQRQEPGNTARAIFFVNATLGWVAGGQEVSRTTDGGAHWSEVAVLPATASVNDITFYDAMRGYFIDSYATDPSLVDQIHGWVVDDAGDIYASSDGGTSWVLEKETNGPLNAIWSVGRFQAWAVGDGGRIWQGGGAWYERDSGASADFTDVFFPEADAENGWVVGTGGVVVSTKDGGFTWETTSLPTTATLNAVSGSTAKCLWFVGSGGTILHYYVPETTRPWTRAPYSSSVRRYHLARLYYRVNDPDDPTCAVSIRIRTLEGRLVKTLWLGQRRTNQMQGAWFRCELPKGRYRFFVRAVDVAGNHQSNVAHDRLVVN